MLGRPIARPLKTNSVYEDRQIRSRLTPSTPNRMYRAFVSSSAISAGRNAEGVNGFGREGGTDVRFIVFKS